MLAVDVRVSLFVLRIWVFFNRREWNYNLPRKGSDLPDLCELIGPGPLCEEWQQAHELHRRGSVSTTGYCVRMCAAFNVLLACMFLLERSSPLLTAMIKTAVVLGVYDLTYRWISATVRYRIPFFLLRRLGPCHSGFRRLRVRSISLAQIVQLSRVGFEKDFCGGQTTDEEIDIRAQAAKLDGDQWLESFQHAADFILVAACFARIGRRKRRDLFF